MVRRAVMADERLQRRPGEVERRMRRKRRGVPPRGVHGRPSAPTVSTTSPSACWSTNFILLRNGPTNWLSPACRSAAARSGPSGRPASSSPGRTGPRAGGGLAVVTSAAGRSPGRSAVSTPGSPARRARDATLVAYLAELHDHQRPSADERLADGGRRGALPGSSPASRAPADGKRTPRLFALCRRTVDDRAGGPRPFEAPHLAARPRRVRRRRPAGAAAPDGFPPSPNGDDDPHGGHLRHVFQLLERQNLHRSAGRLGLHVHRLTRPERIRHVLPGPLRGLLHDLDLHEAGYRASADGPFPDMALYDRIQRLEDIRDLTLRQRRVLRDIRKQLRFRHGHGVFLGFCQHALHWR